VTACSDYRTGFSVTFLCAGFKSKRVFFWFFAFFLPVLAQATYIRKDGVYDLCSSSYHPRDVLQPGCCFPSSVYDTPDLVEVPEWFGPSLLLWCLRRHWPSTDIGHYAMRTALLLLFPAAYPVPPSHDSSIPSPLV